MSLLARIRNPYLFVLESQSPRETLTYRAMVARRYRLTRLTVVADSIISTARAVRAKLQPYGQLFRRLPVALYIVRNRASLHAHASSDSRDCDGRMSRTWSWSVLTPWREAYDVLTMPARYRETFYDTDGRRGTYDGATTDEGYSSQWTNYCARPSCATDAYAQRDYSAERAGY